MSGTYLRCRLYGGVPPCPDADDTCRTECDDEHAGLVDDINYCARLDADER